MQKLLPVVGGLKAYVEEPGLLVSETARRCPFCAVEHRLRRHGTYKRFVLLAGEAEEYKITVVRLFCAATGRTVSLLPDFCVAGRQYGAAALGGFLQAYAAGKSLVVALQSVRPAATNHSVGQSLRSGFLSRDGPIRSYLASIRPRAAAASATATAATGELRRAVAGLLTAMLIGMANAAEVFPGLGVGLHAASGTALA